MVAAQILVLIRGTSEDYEENCQIIAGVGGNSRSMSNTNLTQFSEDIGDWKARSKHSQFRAILVAGGMCQSSQTRWFGSWEW